MIRILLLFVAMGLAPIASAQTDEPLNLDALYQQIDEAIRQSPQYVAERKQEIAIWFVLYIHCWKIQMPEWLF